MPAIELVRLADGRNKRPQVRVQQPRRIGAPENAEFVAVSLLLQHWDAIAPWLVEPLFNDEVHRRAFLALADTAGVLDRALEIADPEAREVLERAAVADLDVDPEAEARNLIGAAVRRELSRKSRNLDPDILRDARDARLQLENLDDALTGVAAAEWLLGWLDRRSEESG
jgi:DNA primase